MKDLTKESFEPLKNKDIYQDTNSLPLFYRQNLAKKFKKNKLAILSLIILSIIIILVILGPFFVPFNYYEQDYQNTNLPPGDKGHIFGTDSLGRDIFSRLWIGGRVSLFIAIIVTLLSMIIGIIYGSVAGYYGGRVDNIMMRIVDILLAIPGLLINIMLLVVLKPGITTIIIAFGITGWLNMARIVRGQVLQVKEQEYVLAARILGADNKRIILKHIIPNIIGPIIIEMTLIIPSAIFGEAFLSYIGLGVRPPMASWGTLASEGIKAMRFYPFQLIIPGVVISLTILSFNLLGDGLRDILDPRLER
jgi:oligopeptide transport system permease protein